MRSLISVLKAISSIGAALVIWLTADEIYHGTEAILPYVLASVFSLAVVILCFALGAVTDRVKYMEDSLGVYIDRGYEQDGDDDRKECPICHSMIDAGVKVCPYCSNSDFENRYFHNGENSGEEFYTDDPDYKGTDYSDEEIVSANFDLNTATFNAIKKQHDEELKSSGKTERH